MNELPVIVSRRSGTDDSGKIYEFKILALLALRCVKNPLIKHAWFASKVTHAGHFNDVIVYVKDKNDICTAYLMQLMHQDYPKNIPEKDFLYDTQTQKRKTNMSDDFSLYKYQRSYLKIKKKLEEDASLDEDGLIRSLRNAHKIVYVIYTNRSVSKKPDFLNVDCNDVLNPLDCSTGEGIIYGFNNTEEFDDEFLDNLTLFSQQAGVSKIDELMKVELKRISSDLTTALNKYMEFIQISIQGVQNNPLYEVLTSAEVIEILTSFCLEDYQIKFSFNEIKKDFSLWEKIIDGKSLVIVESSAAEFLESYVCAKFMKHCDAINWDQELPRSDVYKKASFLESILNKTVGEGGLTVSNVYKALWLRKKVPLLIQVDALQDFKRVETALSLLDDQMKQIIVLTNLKINSPHKSNWLLDLTHLDKERQTMILSHAITLQNRPSTCLENLINKSMYKFIKCKEMVSIILNQYNVGEAQGDVLQFYVPRSISRILFSAEALTETDSKFLLRGIDKDEFDQICKRYKPRIGKIMFESDLRKDFKDYLELVYAGDDFFELKLSYVSSKKLRHRQYVQPNTLNEYYDKPGLVNRWTSLKELFEQDLCVINAYPGMGKTEFLNHAALNAPTSLWILKVTLNKHNDYYKTLKNSKQSALDHLNYFYSTTESSKNEFTKQVFLKFVKQKKVAVLLDGFDELLVTYREEVASIATSLNKNGFKLWLTTRPLSKEYLEEVLNTISRTLNSLSVKDQETFLLQRYKHLAKDETQIKTVEKFVQNLVKTTAKNLSVIDHNFTGLPLQTKILADVFEKDLAKILITNDLTLFNPNFNLIDLYEKFLDEKNDILFKKSGEVLVEVRELFVKFQKLCALIVVFREFNLEKTSHFKEDFDENVQLYSSILGREGVMWFEPKTLEISFVHQTFAEFLAAKWLYENWKGKDLRDLMKCRFELERKFLFSVFDRYAAQNLPLHLSIILKNENECLSLIRSNPESINLTDACGRTGLHLISCYGSRHFRHYYPDVTDYDDFVEIFAALPEHVKIDAKDSTLRYNALEYALSSDSFGIANKLCKIFKNVSFSLDLNNKNFIFEMCEQYQYSHLFLRVCQYFARKELLLKHVDPGTDIRDFCIGKNNYEQHFNKYIWDTVEELVQNTCVDDLSFVSAFGGADDLLRLLNQGVSVNKIDADGNRPLHYASIHNNLQNVMLLLSKNTTFRKTIATVNLQNADGETPLHLALEHKSFEVSRFLIDQGADLTLTNNSDTTVFTTACKFGTIDLIKKMQPMFSDINKQNKNGETALHLSLKHRNLKVAQFLIDEGADVTVTDTSGTSACLYSCMFGTIDVVKKILTTTDADSLYSSLKNHNFDVARFLMSAGNYSNNEVFITACETGKIDIAKNVQADINAQTTEGNTALHRSLKFQNVSLARFLINEGADVNLANDSGMTAYLYACKRGNYDLVKRMISQVADKNLQERGGKTALHLSLRNECFNVANFLICDGVDESLVDIHNRSAFFYACELGKTNLIKKMQTQITSLDGYGYKALHLAFDNDSYDVARFLIHEGADVNLTNDALMNGFLYSCMYGLFDIIKKIRPMVTDINLQNMEGETGLHISLSYDYFDIARFLIDEGADVNLKSDFGMNAFHYACKFGIIDLVKKIRPMVADINAQDKYGKTALHLAIEDEHLAVVRFLIEEGADAIVPAFLYACKTGKVDLVQKIRPMLANINFENALHLALKNEKFFVARFLIEEGADVNLTNASGMTALHYACKFGKINLVKKILPSIIDLNLQNKKGETALQLSFKNLNFDVARLLIDAGANVNVGNNGLLHVCKITKFDFEKKVEPALESLKTQRTHGGTTIYSTPMNEESEITRFLIEAGAEVNLINRFDETPFLFAWKLTTLELVAKMQPTIADINAQNADGETALVLSFKNQNFDVARFLIEAGADVNATNTFPFHFLCKFGKLELVKRIRSMVNDINLQNADGETALHFSLKNENFDVASFLIDEGADVNLCNGVDMTPFLEVCKIGHYEIVKKIRPKMTQINFQKRDGETALHLSLKHQKRDVATFLIDEGADVNLSNNFGETSLFYACRFGDIELVKKIRKFVSDVNLKNMDGDTVLGLSIRNENFEMAKFLNDENADVNVSNNTGMTPFLYACKIELVDVIKKMRSKVIDINWQNTNGQTALHLSIESENFDVARFLIEEGADVNVTDNFDTTPFFLACRFCSTEMVKKVKPTVTDINWQNRRGETALHVSLENERLDIARFLIDEGADVNVTDNYRTTPFLLASKIGAIDLTKSLRTDLDWQNLHGETALHLAFKNMNVDDVACFLIDEGADVNLTDNTGSSAFLSACTLEKLELIKKMRRQIADVNSQRNDGETALHLSLKHRNFDISRFLIGESADVNLMNDLDMSSFFYACKFAKADIVEKMLPMVEDVNLQINQIGTTALYAALENESFDVAHLVIDAGADVNLTNDVGMTAFIYACKIGNIELVKKMRPLVANIDLQNNHGETALHVSVANNHLDVARFLVDEGADVNATDENVVTPYYLACKLGAVDFVEKLLPLVEDVNLQNILGGTALHVCLENEDIEIARFLIEKGADLNLSDDSNMTPFLYLCKYGEIELIENMQANVNLQDTSGSTGLHLALENEHFDVARFLIDQGADVNLTNDLGMSAFQYACEYADLDFIKQIRPMVTNIDLQDEEGVTALQVSLQRQNFELAHFLIDEGADVNIPNDLGVTAFLYACEFGEIDLVEKMRPKVQNINLQENDGKTALHLSLANANFDVAHFLIDEGADLSLFSNFGATPFNYACKFGPIDLIKKILLRMNESKMEKKDNRTKIKNLILQEEGSSIT
ncbi:hypothetical protein FQR65_LT07297 [Abscondita terminalis]|nr:hypothetical protein FQR65_LT07297 [Abscondita terminalis]